MKIILMLSLLVSLYGCQAHVNKMTKSDQEAAHSLQPNSDKVTIYFINQHQENTTTGLITYFGKDGLQPFVTKACILDPLSFTRVLVDEGKYEMDPAQTEVPSIVLSTNAGGMYVAANVDDINLTLSNGEVYYFELVLEPGLFDLIQLVELTESEAREIIIDDHLSPTYNVVITARDSSAEFLD